MRNNVERFRTRLRHECMATQRYRDNGGNGFLLLLDMGQAERLGPPQAWICDPANEPAMRQVWDELANERQAAVAGAEEE